MCHVCVNTLSSRNGLYFLDLFPQLKKSEWAPEYGPATFVPSWGATVTGARKFLIAYNLNLLSTKEQAHRIALDIREQGRGKDQVCVGRHWVGLGFQCVPNLKLENKGNLT